MKHLPVAWFFYGLLFIPTQVSAMSAVDPTKRVAVVGATGRLGRIVVQKLVDDGIPCKILVRSHKGTTTSPVLSRESVLSGNPSVSKEDVISYLGSLNGVDIVQGDVGNINALNDLLQDCDSCLALYGSTRRSKLSDIWNDKVEDEDSTHAKQINYRGVMNLLEAAKGTSCRRIVRITGKGEEPTSFCTILINMLGSMAKAWNYEGEQVLRSQTEMEYTIIRPGVMSEQGPSKEKDDDGRTWLALADNGGNLKVSRIRYSDIASLCIESLKYANAGRSTLTAMTVGSPDEKEEIGGIAKSWGPLLETVNADRREFPTDMLQRHKAAVQSTVTTIGAVTALLLSVLLTVLLR